MPDTAKKQRDGYDCEGFWENSELSMCYRSNSTPTYWCFSLFFDPRTGEERATMEMEYTPIIQKIIKSIKGFIMKTKQDHFWSHAKLTNTYRRHDPGCSKYRHKFDLINGPGSFQVMRRFTDPRTGEKRITVEIEV